MKGHPFISAGPIAIATATAIKPAAPTALFTNNKRRMPRALCLNATGMNKP